MELRTGYIHDFMAWVLTVYHIQIQQFSFLQVYYLGLNFSGAGITERKKTSAIPSDINPSINILRSQTLIFGRSLTDQPLTPSVGKEGQCSN